MLPVGKFEEIISGKVCTGVYSVIRKYAVSARGAKDAGIVADDKPLIMKIVDSLNCSSLNKALIVRSSKYGWGKI